MPVVTDYENEAGDRVVGSAVHYPRFGWTVVVEEPYAEAFAPVVSSIRRILGINLAIVALFGFAAFRIAVSIVRPVEAYGFPQGLRVSVGTPEENQRLLEAFDRILPSGRAKSGRK